MLSGSRPAGPRRNSAEIRFNQSRVAEECKMGDLNLRLKLINVVYFLSPLKRLDSPP